MTITPEVDDITLLVKADCICSFFCLLEWDDEQELENTSVHGKWHTTFSASTICRRWSSRPPAAFSPSSSLSCSTCMDPSGISTWECTTKQSTFADNIKNIIISVSQHIPKLWFQTFAEENISEFWWAVQHQQVSPEVFFPCKNEDEETQHTVFFSGTAMRYAMILWVAPANLRLRRRASMTVSTCSTLVTGAKCPWKVPIQKKIIQAGFNIGKANQNLCNQSISFTEKTGKTLKKPVHE